jgi:hypothetical protein
MRKFRLVVARNLRDLLDDRHPDWMVPLSGFLVMIALLLFIPEIAKALVAQFRAKGPSRNVRYVAELLLPYKHTEGLLGDLDERFPVKCARCGVGKARLWYCLQVFYSLRPLAWSAAALAWEAVRSIGK